MTIHEWAVNYFYFEKVAPANMVLVVHPSRVAEWRSWPVGIDVVPFTDVARLARRFVAAPELGSTISDTTDSDEQSTGLPSEHEPNSGDAT